MMSRLSAGETFLVHGGSSGIGTFAIQIAKHQGAKVFVTAGSEEKLAVCKDLGADVCINYKTEDFVARVKEETGGKGVDVILDSVGATYFQKNVDSLNIDGRLFLLGFMGGAVTQVNLASLFAKRHGARYYQCSSFILGSSPIGLELVESSDPSPFAHQTELQVKFFGLTLSTPMYKMLPYALKPHFSLKEHWFWRKLSEGLLLLACELELWKTKKKLSVRWRRMFGPAIVAGKVKPVVYKYLPLSEAAEGHLLMESSRHIGKILLVA
ncbi:QUINONE OXIDOREDUCTASE PIG3-RELATED [Salix koriyanagi]|uniref:QUINONE OXIDOREDUCTASE PIG3-RELATED n=1 Tax=Salix koriyanagi TaxID=2511006 RepID=A0A9Q0UYR3_9ROSI|nr:QUINONE OXIDOREDUCTASE PIG3-RELATED [Salix koriyanagi]